MDLAGGIGQFLGGLFGDSGAPYEKAMEQWQDYLNQSQNAQNPFYQAGTGAIPKYQEWAEGMKDPAAFINKIMGGYQESPWAKYQQKEGVRAANAFGSASGLTGSTPLMKQAQMNAENISSKDMSNWLQQVLGINTAYGNSQHNLVQGGQNSADQISRLLAEFGRLMGEGAYGQKAGENQDTSNLIGGILKMFLG